MNQEDEQYKAWEALNPETDVSDYGFSPVEKQANTYQLTKNKYQAIVAQYQEGCWGFTVWHNGVCVYGLSDENYPAQTAAKIANGVVELLIKTGGEYVKQGGES